MKLLESGIAILLRKLKESGYEIKPTVYYSDTSYILVDDMNMTVEGLSVNNPEKFREFKELKDSLKQSKNERNECTKSIISIQI